MERPNSKGASNFIVGMFVFVAFLVGTGFVVFMGGTTTLSGEHKVKTMFRDVRGVNVGAPIFLSGIQVGRVSGFQFPQDGNTDSGIVATLSLYKKFANRVKTDSMASITTQGVLGDKVLVISPGTTEAKELAEGGLLPSQQPKELSDIFSKGGNMVETLSTVAANLNTLIDTLNESGRIRNILVNLEKTSAAMAGTTQNLNKADLAETIRGLHSIVEKIDKGQGTLGALVNDSSLHEDLRVLLGGAKRSQMVRFLIRQAISSADAKVAAGEEAPAPTKKK